MTVLRSIALALSCFSIIPVPQVEWNEQNMRHMMCAFPLVGVVIGLLIALWAWLGQSFQFGVLLMAGGFTLIPIIVSGGIHMDGFADVVDAQSSNAEPERKRQILKDPHAGAFATIGVGCYLIAYFALASELQLEWCWVIILALIPVLSRISSGLAVLLFPRNASQGMLSAFKESAQTRADIVALLVMYVVCAAAMLLQAPLVALAVIVGQLVCFFGLRLFANSQFGGMSGDLSGFYLQVAELVMLACLVFVSKAVM